MRRYFWRYSRPVGCSLCLLFLLLLAWFLRWVYGVPPLEAEAEVRRIERQYLRPAGEVRQIIEEGDVYAAAVTVYGDELYTYFLVPENGTTDKTKTLRYADGYPWRDTARGFSWGCTTVSLSGYEYEGSAFVMKSRFYVLVKQADPRAVSGRLEIVSTVKAANRTVTRKWNSSAERECPEYLAFPLELVGGSEMYKQMYWAMVDGHSGNLPVTAEAEAVFYDAEGNEVSRLAFSMVRDAADEEGSEENGA